MKILITGADGFIAKNLITHLQRDENLTLYLYTKKDSFNILEAYLKEVDFIFHLAGVNRPKEIQEFYEGNTNLTKTIVNILNSNGKNPPILFSSSTQVTLDNDYAKSKLEAENLLLEYGKKITCYIYRLPNVFGKFSKPNYNSVVATWCHNIANNLEIQINNKETQLNLVYIDEVIESFINTLKNRPEKNYIEIQTVYKKTLGEIEELLYKFKENRKTLVMPEVGSGFKRALYATYLSYLSVDDFSYSLEGHEDERGTFYEVLKTTDNGQFSLSTTAKGIARGGHYHHTKNEKFLVVKGEAVIQLRHILTQEIIEYRVSSKKMEVVEMIPGYTHNIKNIGSDELILLLWANENYKHDKADTYFLEV